MKALIPLAFLLLAGCNQGHFGHAAGAAADATAAYYGEYPTYGYGYTPSYGYSGGYNYSQPRYTDSGYTGYIGSYTRRSVRCRSYTLGSTTRTTCR